MPRKAKPPAVDPTAPRPDDPQCENCEKRAEVLMHDPDGGKHYLCATHWLFSERGGA